jgi:drug/metabolite transporter (DMT)-like permease
MILIVLNYALLATTFLCNKALVCCIPPLLLTGISSTAAGILLLAWLKLKALPIVVPDKQDLPLLIPAALAASSGAMLLRLYALTTLESFQLSFFSALDPCITAGLCFVLYAERLTKQQAIGIVLASLGSIPMLSAMGFTNTMFSLA